MKTKIYAIIFGLLLAIVVFTLFSKSEQEKISKKNKTFKIENFEEVTKILLENKDGIQISLKPSKDGWILNDKHLVRKHLFNNLREALTKMEPSSPVAKVATQNVIFQMMRNAIKVSIFKGEDKPTKVIYVGGPNLSNTASHMFLEYDGEPVNKIYEVAIPGHRGYITSRFHVKESSWRSMKIFDYNTTDFKSIDIKYFNKNENKGFTLTSNNNNYTLNFNNKEYTHEKLDKKNIVNYILNFENQNTMSYVFQKKEEQQLKDSLLNNYKFAEVIITDTKNIKKHITIVNMPTNKIKENKLEENEDQIIYDVDY